MHMNIHEINRVDPFGFIGWDDTVSRRFVMDLADTIHIRYDTHVHDLRFQNQEFLISTTK